MGDVRETTDVRADVWLWAARFFKTRSLARQAIEGGRVELNESGCKPAKALHAGDRLSISGQGGNAIKLAPSFEQQIAAARTLVGQDPRRAAQVVKEWVSADG